MEWHKPFSNSIQPNDFFRSFIKLYKGVHNLLFSNSKSFRGVSSFLNVPLLSKSARVHKKLFHDEDICENFLLRVFYLIAKYSIFHFISFFTFFRRVTLQQSW